MVVDDVRQRARVLALACSEAEAGSDDVGWLAVVHRLLGRASRRLFPTLRGFVSVLHRAHVLDVASNELLNCARGTGRLRVVCPS
jgi:hypothetical protein